MTCAQQWVYREASRLRFGDTDLGQLTAELGTPTLVYFAGRVRSNVCWLRKGMASTAASFDIAYALKACHHLAIARILQGCGTGCEVMSHLEYELARQAGFGPDQIIVNGLGWSDQLIDRAVDEGAAVLNVDSRDDLDRVAAAAQRSGATARVAVRVIPDIGDPLFAEPGGKLGSPAATGEAAALLERAGQDRRVQCVGVSAHCGHRTTDPAFYGRMAESMAHFAVQQRDALGVPITLLDIGGGLDDRASVEHAGGSAEALCTSVAEAVASVDRSLRIVLEPGRLLVGDAGVVLTKVTARKVSANREWLIVDAGSNLLIPISAARYEAHAVVDDGGPCLAFDIGDGICSPSSVIQRGAVLPATTKPGDILAICYTGSYTLSMAESWGYEVPQVAVVDHGGVEVVLGRELAGRLYYLMTGCLQ